MYRMLYLSCFLVVKSMAMPMQLIPMMPQMPQHIQSPLPLLQEQLMELQAMQQVPMEPMPMNQMQPLIVLLPGPQMNVNTKSNLNKKIKEVINKNMQNGDEDSIVIDAEPIDPIPTLESNEKAILILPNGRLSINSIISAIPWLPIEINVPDTILWMYNGIASIISAIGGQSSQQTMQESRLKYKPYNNNFRNQNVRPIVLIPMQV